MVKKRQETTITSGTPRRLVRTVADDLRRIAVAPLVVRRPNVGITEGQRRYIAYLMGGGERPEMVEPRCPYCPFRHSPTAECTWNHPSWDNMVGVPSRVDR